MKRLLAPALLLAGAGYPFAVYFGLNRVSPAWLALPLALLWLARAAVPSAAASPVTSSVASTSGPALMRLLPWLVGGFCVWLAFTGSQTGLRAYPVVVNALLLGAFGLSLIVGPPVVERMARLRHPDLPPQGVRYTRKVTIVWCLFFAANGSIAAALAFWGNWGWWTLYNGIISYVLMAALMLGEWCVRPTGAKGRQA